MALPTPIPTASRYFNAGTTVIVFIPTIASTALIPTRAEITAGTDLSNETADVAGWKVGSGKIVTPAMGSEYDSNINGKTTVDDSSITFYADVTGEDVRTILPRNTEGYIAIMDGGDVPTQPMDVFKVRVMANGKTRSVGEEAARIEVPFSIQGYAEDVAIPTNP